MFFLAIRFQKSKVKASSLPPVKVHKFKLLQENYITIFFMHRKSSFKMIFIEKNGSEK